MTAYKAIIVGNTAADKYPLLYALAGWETCRKPRNITIDVEVDGDEVEVELWSTLPEGSDFDRVRHLGYIDADVTLLCFALDNPATLQTITDKWAPDMDTHCPGVPRILVATRSEKREGSTQPEQAEEDLVKEEEAKAVAESIGALTYMEVSVENKTGLKELLETATRAAIQFKAAQQKKNSTCVIL